MISSKSKQTHRIQKIAGWLWWLSWPLVSQRCQLAENSNFLSAQWTSQVDSLHPNPSNPSSPWSYCHHFSSKKNLSLCSCHRGYHHPHLLIGQLTPSPLHPPHTQQLFTKSLPQGSFLTSRISAGQSPRGFPALPQSPCFSLLCLEAPEFSF